MTKGKTTTTGKKDFNPEVGFWPAKSGNGFTRFVTEEVKGELEKIQIGSTLLLKQVESDNEKAPSYRIVIFPPSEQQKTADRI